MKSLHFLPFLLLLGLAVCFPLQEPRDAGELPFFSIPIAAKLNKGSNITGHAIVQKDLMRAKSLAESSRKTPQPSSVFSPAMTKVAPLAGIQVVCQCQLNFQICQKIIWLNKSVLFFLIWQLGSYVVNVTMGRNNYTLLVDSGSSNLWVGARSEFIPSADAVFTNETVFVTYGQGFVEGTKGIVKIWTWCTSF